MGHWFGGIPMEVEKPCGDANNLPVEIKGFTKAADSIKNPRRWLRESGW
jgi:hypothetical protein